MLYLLQRDGDYALEVEMLKGIIKNSFKYKLQIDRYQVIDIDEVSKYGKETLPIGSLSFVYKWLHDLYNADIKQIEIPEILCKPEYLKRKYTKIGGNRVPKCGNFFIKSLDKIKDWTYIGDVEYIQDKIKSDSSYILSKLLAVYSEWRVYVINDKITNIANYDGDVLCFPNVELIQKMIQEYSKVEDRPKSYTMDIMVTNEGTALLEIHTFVSVGLYSSLWDETLLGAYKDGIDYCIKYGK